MLYMQKLVFFYLVLVVFISPATGQDVTKGIVLYKVNNVDENTEVKAVSYKKVKQFRASTVIVTSDNRDVRFSMHVWHMVISYQEIYKVDIVNQDGFNFISDLNKKYKMISKTYPQSSIHLKARIKILDEIADKWNAGKVRSSGRWMSKIDYDTVLELKKKKRDRDRKFKEEEKLAKEKRNSELKALMKKRENDLKLQRLKDLEEKEETERSRRIHELQRSKLDLINKIKAIDRELPSMKKDLNLIKDRIKEINDKTK